MKAANPKTVDMKASRAARDRGGVQIDPTAVVEPGAVLGRNVSVGAYSVIGAEVVVGDATEIMNHVTLRGPTTIGRANRFYPYASIGQDPQDKKYSFQGRSELEIGDGNVFREFVTVHRGTPHGKGITRIGRDNWLMAYCHVAHDCVVGDGTVFSNNSTLGGHVRVEDGAYLGGFTAVHQFCAVGRMTMTGGQTMIAKDVPPFCIAAGNRVRLYGVNRIGMERQGVSPEEIAAMRRAYRIFFRAKLPAQKALRRLEAEFAESPVVMQFVDFVRGSTRGICR